MDIDFDTDDWVYEHYETAGYDNTDVYAKGSAVSPIDGGLFNLNTLISVD
jgi:hypothetical protein